MVAALAAGAVLAQTAQRGPARGRPGLGANLRQRVIKNLNLTDAQKAQAKTIFQQAKQTAAPFQAKLKQDRQDMVAAVKSNDASKIQGLSSDAGTLQGQLMAIRVTAMAQFYAILTPEQQTKLDQMQGKIEQLLQQLRALGQSGN